MTGQNKTAFLESANILWGPMEPGGMAEIPICQAGCSPRNHDPKTCAGTDTMDSCPRLLADARFAGFRPSLALYSK